MSRFRVWCKNECRYEKHPCFISDQGMIFQNARLDPLMLSTHIVEMSTMHACRGKEVYESDIIRYSDGSHEVFGIVRYGPFKAWASATSTQLGFHIEWINDGANLWGDWWRVDALYWLNHEKTEVFGTVHSHPELSNEE